MIAPAEWHLGRLGLAARAGTIPMRHRAGAGGTSRRAGGPGGNSAAGTGGRCPGGNEPKRHRSEARPRPAGDRPRRRRPALGKQLNSGESSVARTKLRVTPGVSEAGDPGGAR
jgi:hypothetical protein